MDLMKYISSLPLRLMVFVFILWSYSPYVPVITNVGFYSDDANLKKPFHGDTIHFSLLLLVELAVYPCLIYLSEQYLKKNELQENKHPYELRPLLRRYYSGVLYTLGFTELIKICVSELRPHFLTTCIPHVIQRRSDGFVTDFICTGVKEGTLLAADIFKSFPSGHASLSVYSFIFFTIHLFSRLENRPITSKTYCWSRCLTVITFLWTVICCISRIMDHRHFWWDVLVGVLIGIITGLISIKCSIQPTDQE